MIFPVTANIILILFGLLIISFAIYCIRTSPAYLCAEAYKIIMVGVGMIAFCGTDLYLTLT